MRLVNLVLLVLLLVVGVAEAKAGLAISPSAGVFPFPSQGGSIAFTVYNTGNEEATYRLVIEGDSSIALRAETTEALIAGGKSKVFQVFVSPLPQVVWNQPYPIKLAVDMVSTASKSTATASSEVRVTFSSQAGYLDYQTTSGQTVSNQLLIVAVVSVILLVIYSLIRTRGSW